jgi:hypothetical protein
MRYVKFGKEEHIANIASSLPGCIFISCLGLGLASYVAEQKEIGTQSLSF